MTYEEWYGLYTDPEGAKLRMDGRVQNMLLKVVQTQQSCKLNLKTSKDLHTYENRK